MVKTDVLAACCLPECFLKQLILRLVPLDSCALACLEAETVPESACITRVGIQAPESVVDVVLYHVITEKCHPFEVVALHVSYQ